MVNADILNGLQLAISKGNSLRQAMLSFYNAGYKKEDIEEAARSIQNPPQTIQQTTSTQISQQTAQKQSQNSPQTIQQPPIKSKDSNLPNPKKLMKTSPQKVSSYGSKKGFGAGITIVLVILLFILILTLIGIFVFRNQLTSLLGSLF